MKKTNKLVTYTLIAGCLLGGSALMVQELKADLKIEVLKIAGTKAGIDVNDIKQIKIVKSPIQDLNNKTITGQDIEMWFQLINYVKDKIGLVMLRQWAEAWELELTASGKKYTLSVPREQAAQLVPLK